MKKLSEDPLNNFFLMKLRPYEYLEKQFEGKSFEQKFLLMFSFQLHNIFLLFKSRLSYFKEEKATYKWSPFLSGESRMMT